MNSTPDLPATAALAVFVEMQSTGFAERFAMLRDRFGTPWMLLHQPASTSGHREDSRD